MRVWDGDVAALRAEYLFGLAHVCHVGPGEVRDMRVLDFAVLIKGIDDWLAAQRQNAAG